MSCTEIRIFLRDSQAGSNKRKKKERKGKGNREQEEKEKKKKVTMLEEPLITTGKKNRKCKRLGVGVGGVERARNEHLQRFVTLFTFALVTRAKNIFKRTRRIWLEVFFELGDPK